MSKQITNEEFKKLVATAELPIALDFYADWCGPCRSQGPIFAEAEEEADGKAEFFKVNVDVEKELSKSFGVKSIPTIVVIKGGEESFRHVGVTPKGQILEAIGE